MKNPILLMLFVMIGLQVRSQVGINTAAPSALLDITAGNPQLPENTDGILIPRIADFPLVNPTLLQDGMLVYLKETVGYRTSGFYYWCGSSSQWIKIKSENCAMMRSFSGVSIGVAGTAFNFSNELFNNIEGATYSSNQVLLPPGIYEIESNLRFTVNVAMEWNMRLGGVISVNSVPGSSTFSALVANTGTNAQKGIISVNSTSGGLDFVITSGLGTNLIPGGSYLLIRKMK